MSRRLAGLYARNEFHLWLPNLVRKHGARHMRARQVLSLIGFDQAFQRLLCLVRVCRAPEVRQGIDQEPAVASGRQTGVQNCDYSPVLPSANEPASSLGE